MNHLPSDNQPDIFTLLDQFPDSVVTMDANLNITGANRKFKDQVTLWSNISADRLIGTNVRVLFPDFVDSGRERIHREVLETGIPRVIDIPGRSDQGENKYFILRIIKFGDGLASITSNLTIVRRMEEKLQQTRRLYDIGKFAGGIAHDFNNLLTSILVFSKSIYKNLGDEKKLEYSADRITTAGKRAADLADKLLQFSARQKPGNRAFDLHRIIDDALKLLPREQTLRITVHRHLQAATPLIKGSESQVHSAILNIVKNASEAIPAKGDIDIRTDIMTARGEYEPGHCLADLAPGNYIELSIKDTGKGMDPETCERMFDPFFSTKKDKGGTGLGMAAVYGTIRQHGGAVTCFSQPGEGTEILMYLPVYEPQADSMTPAGSGAVPKKRNILVIDDDPSVLETVQTVLKPRKHTVTAFLDGNMGTGYFNHHVKDIDLAILDLILPGHSGREIFLYLKNMKPGLRILLLSSIPDDTAANELREYDGCTVVNKPLAGKELLAATDALLG